MWGSRRTAPWGALTGRMAGGPELEADLYWEAGLWPPIGRSVRARPALSINAYWAPPHQRAARLSEEPKKGARPPQ
jgi:hypothetical protein